MITGMNVWFVKSGPIRVKFIFQGEIILPVLSIIKCTPVSCPLAMSVCTAPGTTAVIQFCGCNIGSEVNPNCQLSGTRVL